MDTQASPTLVEQGYLKALQRCSDEHDIAGNLGDLRIRPSGRVSAQVNAPSEARDCLLAAASALKFPPSGNVFQLTATLALDTPGQTVFPKNCEISDVPCYMHEADPAQSDYASRLLSQAVDKIDDDCKNADAALEWLRAQKDVVDVSGAASSFK